MASIVKFSFATAVLLATNVPYAQPVERPHWRVGDHWVFRDTTQGVEGSTEWSRKVVAETTKGEFKVDLGTQQLATYDTESNRLHARGPEFTAKYFSFPMEVGKSWSSNIAIQGDLWSGDEQSTWTVKAREKVSVPAGTFECLRVEGTIWRNWTDGRQVAQGYNKANSEWTYWYCPEVQWFAKRRIRAQPAPWLPYTITDSLLLSFTRVP